MDKVTSVFNFQKMGDVLLNPWVEKASFVSRSLEYKRNYFITIDREGGFQTFAYWPVKFELGDVVRFTKYPGILSDGFLVLPKNQVVEINIDEVSRGKFFLGSRAISFDDLITSTLAPPPPEEEGVLNVLGEVDLLTYSVSPWTYWI